MVTFFCPANLFGQTVVAVTGPMLTISITVLSTFPVQLPLTKGFLLGTDTPDDGHLGMFCPFDSWDVCRTGVLGRPNWEKKKKNSTWVDHLLLCVDMQCSGGTVVLNLWLLKYGFPLLSRLRILPAPALTFLFFFFAESLRHVRSSTEFSSSHSVLISVIEAVCYLWWRRGRLLEELQSVLQ